MLVMMMLIDDDDVDEKTKDRGETENMGVCTKERKGVTAEVLMATPCTNSLGGESGGQKHEGREGRCFRKQRKAFPVQFTLNQ